MSFHLKKKKKNIFYPVSIRHQYSFWFFSSLIFLLFYHFLYTGTSVYISFFYIRNTWWWWVCAHWINAFEWVSQTRGTWKYLLFDMYRKCVDTPLFFFFFYKNPKAIWCVKKPVFFVNIWNSTPLVFTPYMYVVIVVVILAIIVALIV